MSEKMRARDWSFLLSEASGNRSREAVTMASGNGVVLVGTAVGEITSNKKFKPSKASGSDGSEDAKAVLGQTVDTNAGDAEAVIVRRDAEVKKDLIVFDASVDDDTKRAAKIKQLAATGIIVR
ncbi:head decoration protein [Pseudovibrio ascidiaceicola]|uniref:head decoration protein n=1 Tax=Pseudovibrio ascidiaceicola TaxID=285279 RepID=UPI000D69EC41|nr:head decoration protein [Pseudovibrio ascidiaceicola]